jgi:hypothetical protein
MEGLGNYRAPPHTPKLFRKFYETLSAWQLAVGREIAFLLSSFGSSAPITITLRTAMGSSVLFVKSVFR